MNVIKDMKAISSEYDRALRKYKWKKIVKKKKRKIFHFRRLSHQNTRVFKENFRFNMILFKISRNSSHIQEKKLQAKLIRKQKRDKIDKPILTRIKQEQHNTVFKTHYKAVIIQESASVTKRNMRINGTQSESQLLVHAAIINQTQTNKVKIPQWRESSLMNSQYWEN